MACTIASAPPLTATPICKGWKKSCAAILVELQHTLATNLRVVSPEAMGRIPPLFFVSAHKLAPANHCATSRGTFPERRQLTTHVEEFKAFSADPDAGPVTASIMWDGLSQRGLGQRTWGKRRLL